jgi:DNA-binding NarL/FixJ family response regulator
VTAETPTSTATAIEEPPAPAGIRVVLVDSRPERRAVIRSVLEHSGVAATVEGEAGDRAEALTAVEQCRAELVVVDLQEPAQDGLDTVGALRARFPALVIVVSSFIGGPATAGKAMAEGANAYLLKPFTARDIVAAMQAAPRSAPPVEPKVAPAKQDRPSLTSH